MKPHATIPVNDVACPHCRAEPGRNCRVYHADGRPSSARSTPHVARRLAFRVAKAGEPVRP